MATFALGYVIVTLLIVLAMLLYVNRARQRRGAGGTEQVPPGFEPTAEISVDPTTGIKQRVWYNARTGQRFYETLADDSVQ